MARWVPLEGDPISGDVIRWRDFVWKEKRSKNSRLVKMGERLITAQVESAAMGWVNVVIMHCKTTPDKDWWKALPPELQERETLSVRREKLRLGGVERYQWGGEDGESVRGLLTSKFRRAVSGQ